MSTPKVTVSALNRYIKEKFASDVNLQNIFIVGELSNVKCHRASGHWYLTLKDENAAIAAVMFRGKASQLQFTPKDGLEVIVQGSVACYEKTGQYQVYIDRMMEVGQGSLQKRYEELKKRLIAEGVLKTKDRRRPLPSFPQKIVLVTSPTGAVIRDMVTTIRRRFPQVDLLLIPANVQGVLGADSIVEALDQAYAMTDVDLIICGRGGGSLEDLWCFNEEKVVRKIALSPVPIISAVGHETDFTLADFAADLRAGTPSIAAELAVPAYAELKARLQRSCFQLDQALTRTLSEKKKHLQRAIEQPLFKDPVRFLAPYMMLLDQKTSAFELRGEQFIEQQKFALAKRAEKLTALNPLEVLARGYGLCSDGDGHVVTSAAAVAQGETLYVDLQDGQLETVVQGKKESKSWLKN